MDSMLIALKLIIDELDLDLDVFDFSHRKEIQKTIYLCQIAGVDLGYRFSWNKKGPYSSSLSSDYRSLSSLLNADDKSYEDKVLLPKIQTSLRKIREISSPPESITIEKADWLELLASLHYLQKVGELDRGETKEFLDQVKPHLSRYFKEAASVLRATFSS